MDSNWTDFCAQLLGPEIAEELDLSLGIAGAIYLIVFGSLNVAFYASVMVVLARNWDQFPNPFHKCMVALGVCDLYILLHANLYSPITVLAGKRPFGFYADVVLGSFYYAANWSAHEFQILYAFNRFCGVVLFTRYKGIFSPRNIKWMIGACYAFGCCSVSFFLLFGVPFVDRKLGTTFFSFQMDITNPAKVMMTDVFESIIVTLPVVLAMVTLYPISFVYIRRRNRTPSSFARRRTLRTETKLLIVGFIQALFYLFGYLNFPLLGCRVPFWVNFHIYGLYVMASPYLYLIFDLRLRQAYIQTFSPRVRSAEEVELDSLHAEPLKSTSA